MFVLTFKKSSTLKNTEFFLNKALFSVRCDGIYLHWWHLAADFVTSNKNFVEKFLKNFWNFFRRFKVLILFAGLTGTLIAQFERVCNADAAKKFLT